MKLKKILTILLITVLLTIGVNNVFALENTKPTIVVSSCTANCGDTVTLTVAMQNNPGINTFTLGFEYDSSALQLVNVEKDDALEGNYTYSKRAVWLSSQDTTYGGVALHLTFRIADEAQSGDYAVAVTYRPGDICNLAEDEVLFVVRAGGIRVMSDNVYDINSDGTVDAADLTRLLRHVARIEPISNSDILQKADFNKDGFVDAADVTLLAQKIQ